MDSGREYETHAESTHVYGTRMRVYMCHLPLALQSSLSELSKRVPKCSPLQLCHVLSIVHLQYPRKRNWVSSEHLVFLSFWILLSYSYIGRVTFCKRIQQSPSFQSILFPASIPLLHSSQSHGNTNNGRTETTNNIITITQKQSLLPNLQLIVHYDWENSHGLVSPMWSYERRSLRKVVWLSSRIIMVVTAVVIIIIITTIIVTIIITNHHHHHANDNANIFFLLRQTFAVPNASKQRPLCNKPIVVGHG